jgi:peptide/nickel transport system permease protein
MTVGLIFLNSIPYYIYAILLLFILGFQLDWFPIGARLPEGVEPGWTLEFVSGLLYHAALPILSLLIAGFGGRAIGMRGNSVRVMGEDYVRVAHLRGLKPSRITLSYIARNALLPMYTNLLIAIGFMFGGSVILEQIFNYTGVGYYLFSAISSRDYPLMMGAFLVITVAVVISILIGDLTYGLIDPRAGSGGEGRESY